MLRTLAIKDRSADRANLLYTFIHLQLGARAESDHMRLFAAIAKKLDSDFRLIIADNQFHGFEQQGEVYRLGADNVYREFSGWEVARRFVLEKGLVGRGVFLSNDTLLRHHVFDAPRVDSFLRAIADSEKVKRSRYLVGEVHDFPCPPPYLGGSSMKSYVPTMFVYFDADGFRSVPSFTPDVERGFRFALTPNGESVVELTPQSRSAYMDYLESWLYKPSAGPKWYAHQPLNPKNFDRMKLKLHSIFLEHYLSQSFVENGGTLVDARVYLKRNPVETLSVYLQRIALYFEMKSRRG
ncbi:MAG: hypothetical protein FJ184_02135 [Gammaproteobacteria bacterium]|nr:hypothetical protein [Gammaproteobacteria bacterium]